MRAADLVARLLLALALLLGLTTRAREPRRNDACNRPVRGVPDRQEKAAREIESRARTRESDLQLRAAGLHERR